MGKPRHINRTLAVHDQRMTPEDFRALTPLTYAHINPYGKFELDMQQRLPLDAA